MDLAVIFLALGALIFGAWQGLSVLVLAPVLAVAASFLAGAPVLAGFTQIFMPATGSFVIAFFPLFVLGAIFGRIMEVSGAARRLALAIATGLGADRAILAVVLACAILTYGGVSLFVVAFAAWPLARALFARTGLSPRLIPASIALGAFTFTMTALPGTPSIQNAIPMAHFGTTAFAAPGLGLIAGAIMLGLGLAWLGMRARQLCAGHACTPEVPSQTPVRDFSAVSLPAALLPIVSVALVTLIMGSLVLPGLDTTYLALPQYGETEIGRVKGLWSVTVALVVAIGLALILTRPDKPLAELGAGAESALLPLFNTACLVGFGAVIASLPGFEALQTAMDGVAGGNLVVSAAVSAGALAGITGSASGGMSIALEALGPQLMAAALQQGTDPGLLHRVIALATGGLDTLPHNGAVVTLLGICGLTHREAYGDIFVVAVVIPLLACAVVIGLGLAFGGF